MFTFLLVVQAIIAALLVTVILMQRSEGGGLTTGSSGGGLMSARGAADFLTRATAILATVFVAMCILLAFLAANRGSGSIDTSLAKSPAAQTAPAAGAPTEEDVANIVAAAENQAAANESGGVPLVQ